MMLRACQEIEIKCNDVSAKIKYIIRHHESEYLMCHKALMSCHENVINYSNRNDSVILSIQPYR